MNSFVNQGVIIKNKNFNILQMEIEMLIGSRERKNNFPCRKEQSIVQNSVLL